MTTIIRTGTVRGGHCSVGSDRGPYTTVDGPMRSTHGPTHWEAHVESGDGTFRAISFLYGVGRPCGVGTYDDPHPGLRAEKPAGTGDVVRAAFTREGDEPPPERVEENPYLTGRRRPDRSWLERLFVPSPRRLEAPIRRISQYRATITGGHPTTYPRSFGCPNYWYVEMEAHFEWGHLRTSPCLGTTDMPFRIGEEITVTVDLMRVLDPPYQKKHPLEDYTYST